MGAAKDLEGNLPVAMTMAAFMGVAWYICVELNIRLFLTFLRKKGLYFWACCIGSWGVLTQPLFMVLADFGQITNLWVAITLIYISWWMMVVPQSVVLYSRLHLVISNLDHHRYVLYMIIFTTIFFSFPTIGLGIAGQASGIPRLMSANLIWDRIQVSVFFVQETIISVMYIIETRRVLQNRATLGENDKDTRTVMRQLIYINLLVVFLDITLLGMSYSPYFYVQAAYKPCVYGVKLRMEFAILNRLAHSVRANSSRGYDSQSLSFSNGFGNQDNPGSGKQNNSGSRQHIPLERRRQSSEAEMLETGVRDARSSTQSLEAAMDAQPASAQKKTELSVVKKKPEMVLRPEKQKVED